MEFTDVLARLHSFWRGTGSTLSMAILCRSRDHIRGHLMPMQKRALRTSPQLRIRVDLTPDCSVGPGKVSLLEAIEREGSLSVAARSIGMSYRRAWNLLADLNGSFAKPVVATAVGGLRGGGARVTEYGHALIAAFRQLERGALRLAARQMRSFEPVAPAASRGKMKRRPVTAGLRGTRTQR